MVIVQKDQVAMIQKEVSNALKLVDVNKVHKNLEIKSSSYVTMLEDNQVRQSMHLWY